MDDLIDEDVWAQVSLTKGKVVLGTKRLYASNIGEHDEVMKHKCRFVSHGRGQTTRSHCTESPSPTATAAIIRMALATGVLEDMEMRHVDFEQAFLMSEIDTKFYIELPEEYRKFPDAVGGLSKAIYGLVQFGRCWNLKPTGDLK